MTYYWEAAAQVLGATGWRPPITFAGTDATLEEVSLAAAEPAACWPRRPTGGWSAPCTGPRGSAAASARTSPTTTAP